MTEHNIHELNPQTIAICGDWHGNTRWALNIITGMVNWEANRPDAFVHCGDFGFWPGPAGERYLKLLSTALVNAGVPLFWVDGNHENHERLIRMPIDEESGTRKIAPNIYHLPRGFRWNWSETVFMGVGGAHSVDRQSRKEGSSWWPGEFLTEEEVEYASRAGRVDVMITHDVPEGANCPVLTRKTEGWPPIDLAKSKAHRELLRVIVDAVKPDVLYHGHMHCRYDDELPVKTKDGWKRVQIHGLAEDGGGHVSDNVVLMLLGEEEPSALAVEE